MKRTAINLNETNEPSSLSLVAWELTDKSKQPSTSGLRLHREEETAAGHQYFLSQFTWLYPQQQLPIASGKFLPITRSPVAWSILSTDICYQLFRSNWFDWYPTGLFLFFVPDAKPCQESWLPACNQYLGSSMILMLPLLTLFMNM